MVVISSYFCNYFDCITNHFWRFFCCNSFYIFNILKVKWIKKHKEILLQILVFTCIGFLFHKTWMLYYAGLLVIILPFSQISESYIYLINRIINQVGVVIKTILFTLLFIFIMIPIGFILRIKKKENEENYVIINKTTDKSSFLKMW